MVELLETEGLEKFVASWEELLVTVTTGLDRVHGTGTSDKS